MPFIQRKEGEICGVFANLQPGYAEEELPEDSQEIRDFLNPPKDYAQLRSEAYVAAGVTVEAIAEALIEHAGGKPQKLQQLMQMRDMVRAEIPKVIR